MQKTCNITECNIYDLLKTLSSRYVAFILIELNNGPLKFSDLSKCFSYLTNTQLTRCLKKLISEELVIKTNASYELTPYGQAVTKHLIALEELVIN